MKALFRCAVLILSFFVCFLCWAQPPEKQIFLREDFTALDNWRTIVVPRACEQTQYSIESKDGEHYLKARSNASASGLVYKGEFNVYEYPRVKWRWKVDNIYEKANPEKKSGDDYPIRIYIAFKYDPEKAGTFERIKYGIAKKIYGEYPPQSSLIYVWASREDQKEIVVSPYSNRSKVIALEKGPGQVGTWKDEEIDIVNDYRRAFGTDPPPVADIAVMNDSDNTKEKSQSYVRYIEVYKNGRHGVIVQGGKKKNAEDGT